MPRDVYSNYDCLHEINILCINHRDLHEFMQMYFFNLYCNRLLYGLCQFKLGLIIVKLHSHNEMYVGCTCARSSITYLIDSRTILSIFDYSYFSAFILVWFQKETKEKSTSWWVLRNTRKCFSQVIESVWKNILCFFLNSLKHIILHGIYLIWGYFNISF